jgi:hypothetical protein
MNMHAGVEEPEHSHAIQQVERNCPTGDNLMGHYPASGGNSVPTFRDNLSVPSSRVKNP